MVPRAWYSAARSRSRRHQQSNPQARNLFEIIGRLQEREGLRLKVQAVR